MHCIVRYVVPEIVMPKIAIYTLCPVLKFAGSYETAHSESWEVNNSCFVLRQLWYGCAEQTELIPQKLWKQCWMYNWDGMDRVDWVGWDGCPGGVRYKVRDTSMSEAIWKFSKKSSKMEQGSLPKWWGAKIKIRIFWQTYEWNLFSDKVLLPW